MYKPSVWYAWLEYGAPSKAPHLIWAISVSDGPTVTGGTGASSISTVGLSRGDKSKEEKARIAEEKAMLLADEASKTKLLSDDLAQRKLALMERQVNIGEDEARAMLSNSLTLTSKQKIDELKFVYELETDETAKESALNELKNYLKLK